MHVFCSISRIWQIKLNIFYFCRDCYKSKVYVDTDLIVYTDGEIVVVRFTQDERWHRAKIITSDPDNNRVQVMQIFAVASISLIWVYYNEKSKEILNEIAAMQAFMGPWRLNVVFSHLIVFTFFAVFQSFCNIFPLAKHCHQTGRYESNIKLADSIPTLHQWYF